MHNKNEWIKKSNDKADNVIKLKLVISIIKIYKCVYLIIVKIIFET